MLFRLLVFLIINFAALGIGSMLMGGGPVSDWYQQLNKAPWTPPGWTFGVAWTTIMVCFSIYMARLWGTVDNKPLLALLFALQWMLNVGWNPVFFRMHQLGAGMAILVALTLLIAGLMALYHARAGMGTLLILPYFLWLLIACSLNGYAWLKN